MATDLNGIPLAVQVSAGQDSEIRFASQLLGQIAVQRNNGFIKRNPKALLADRAYISQSFRKELRRRHIKVVIPDKCNTKRYLDGRVKFDKALYRLRNVVERCIGLLKEKRKISSRYEKTARNYLSMIKLGCILYYLMLLSN